MPLLSEMPLPSPLNWQEFETLCLSLWKEIWNDPNAQKNGRGGHPQKGVDIFGKPKDTRQYQGVQCKGKDRFTDQAVTISELEAEVQKAKQFRPKISHFILATTAPRDVHLQESTRLLSDKRLAQKQFTVSLFAWDDIRDELTQRVELCRRLYPQLFAVNTITSDHDTIEQYYQAFDRYAFRQAMYHEEPLAFVKAIEDTRVSITTGLIRLSDGQQITKVKGKSLLEDSDARSAFDQVVDRLFLIEETWKTAVRDGRVENGCISYDESLLQFMDNTRNELIEIANGVFLRYGLAPLSKIRIPVERGLGNTTTHSRRSHLLSHRYESEPPRNPVKGEQTRVVPHIAPPYRSDSLDFFDVIVQQPRFIEQSKRKPEEKTMDGATEKEVKE